MKCVGLLSFTLIASLMAGIAVFGQTSGTISPVPAWPADGNIPDYLKHNYVFLGTRIGEIIVSYPASLDDPREMGRKTFSFELHNLVDPTFSIQTVEHPDGTYVYYYVVRNGPSAKQFIRRWSFTSQATDLSA